MLLHQREDSALRPKTRSLQELGCIFFLFMSILVTFML
jgi:hypothetical protein